MRWRVGAMRLGTNGVSRERTGTGPSGFWAGRPRPRRWIDRQRSRKPDRLESFARGRYRPWACPRPGHRGPTRGPGRQHWGPEVAHRVCGRPGSGGAGADHPGYLGPGRPAGQPVLGYRQPTRSAERPDSGYRSWSWRCKLGRWATSRSPMPRPMSSERCWRGRCLTMVWQPRRIRPI